MFKFRIPYKITSQQYFIKHLQFKRKFSITTTKNATAALIGDDFIVKSRIPDFKAITGITVPEYVWTDLEKKYQAPAFECFSTGVKYTHGEIYKQSCSFATALIQAGIKPGDCLVLAMPNMPEFVVCLLGILNAGGIASTINPNYTADEIERQVIISEAKMVITIPQFLPTIRKAQGKCPTLKSIVIIGDSDVGCHTFKEMIKVNPNQEKFIKGSQINTKETVASLLFSSGTTGLPKGVELTHSNLVSNLAQHTSPDFTHMSKLQNGEPAERMIGILPFYHIFAFNAIIFSGLLNGANVLTMSKFQPTDFIKCLEKYKPTLLTLVPPIIQFLVNSPDVKREHFESVRCIQVGAAPTGVNTVQKLLDKAGKYICFQETYGLSETSPAALIMNPSTKNKKLGSCGTLVPGTEGKIVDIATGEPLGPNTRGELHLRGPQVMKGYYRNEEATKDCIDPQNWFHTGDIGYYDEDGYFYVVDRLKELIKVKGLQVAPAELEDLLRKHASVLDVAVIGIPDERAGELPRAYIVKKPGSASSTSEVDIQNYLEGKVAKYKELKGGVEFVDQIPKVPSGKISRRELKADYLKRFG